VEKRKPRELLSDASPFNVNVVRELLARDVLGRKLKTPADAELEELARVLNVWHSDYHRDQTYRLLNQTKKKARDALAALKDSCAILRKDTHRHVASAIEDAAPDWVHETLARRLHEIGAIEKLHAVAAKSSVIADLDSFVGERWLAVSGAPIEDFRNAMLPANPECPSSDDLRHIGGLQKGGSGSSVIEIMRHAGGVASDGLRLSGA
jgi:hypothetical protein